MRGFRTMAPAIPVLAYVVAAAIALPATAEPAPGLISAKAFAGLSKTTPISVEFTDDTVLNNRLLPFIESELRAHGYQVRAGAAHVLVFETAVHRRFADRTGVTIAGNGGSDGIRHLDFRLELPWSRDPGLREATQYRLSFTLRRDAEPPMWMGAAVVARRQADWYRVQSAMAAALVNLIGRTEPRRPLHLD